MHHEIGFPLHTVKHKKPCDCTMCTILHMPLSQIELISLIRTSILKSIQVHDCSSCHRLKQIQVHINSDPVNLCTSETWSNHCKYVKALDTTNTFCSKFSIPQRICETTKCSHYSNIPSNDALIKD